MQNQKTTKKNKKEKVHNQQIENANFKYPHN